MLPFDLVHNPTRVSLRVFQDPRGCEVGQTEVSDWQS